MTRLMGLSALAGAALITAGCYSPQPRVGIDFEKTAYRHERSGVRIGIEPYDTAEECKNAFWYDLGGRNTLPVYVAIENNTDEEVIFNTFNMTYTDPKGINWINGTPDAAAVDACEKEITVKAAIEGGALGLLALPMAPLMQKGCEAEYKQRIEGFKVQAFPTDTFTVFPGGRVDGSVFYVRPKGCKTGNREVNGGKVGLNYVIRGEPVREEMVLGAPSNYLTR